MINKAIVYSFLFVCNINSDEVDLEGENEVVEVFEEEEEEESFDS